MTVYIDIHEPDDIERHISSLGIKTERTKLDVGDYYFYGITIERKTVHDLYNSIVSGRLWNQLFTLKDNSDRCLLLVTGELPVIFSKEDIKRRNIIIGGISSVMLSIQIPVIMIRSDIDASYFISQMYLSCGKDKSRERPIPVKKKYESIEEIRENMLACIPKIGIRNAKNILKRYKTIRDVCNASIEDLKKIEGISNKRAYLILKVLREEV